MSGAIARLGLDLPKEAWRITCFFAVALERAVRVPLCRTAIATQIRFTGRRAAGAALVVAALAGVLLALLRSSAGAEVGARVSLALIREWAPALAALVLAARAGAAVTAELATLRTGGHIDALETAEVDAHRYLATPRILALLLAAPLTAAFIGLAGIVAGCLVSVLALGLDGASFMARTRSAVGLADLSVGLAKATLFGALVACLSTYRGFHGQGVLRALAEIAVLVVALNLGLTALLEQIR